MLSLLPSGMQGQSVARQWNDCTLGCIRKYAPKPTVHARNLFHASVVMYDMWAVYDDEASPFFLGSQWGNFNCPFDGIAEPVDVQAAQEKAMSYAMYRLLWQRYTSFVSAGNLALIQGYINTQMAALGYDPSITSTDYSDGDPAKLGNYIAAKMQEFALQDGSNQQNNYANLFYATINGQLQPQLPGNPNVTDPNNWQSMCLTLQCEQGTGPGFDEPCEPIECSAPALTPEWGRVVPFALTPDQHSIINRNGNDYDVYLDPGAPPYLDTTVQAGLDESFFKWGFVANIIWHSFHNNDDGVMIDISPASVGNLDITNASQLPTTFTEYQAFYDLMNGGVYDNGYAMNPATNMPYDAQVVPRADYTRVLSQFWADGPNSETPPGHWFTLVNYVMDHPLFEKRWEGQGPILNDLEWDVRAYFTLGGGIHDAAVACWGAKGAYDYTRPIMAIRWMADKGQCTDVNLPHYHPAGLPLIPGYIELVQSGDELAGENDENVDKIKVFSWRGPVAGTGVDGAGWLLGENWWTYQTSTFVTPPFPGYYSGHSTYSRTGAEILTRITGDEYFPGGMAEFHAEASTYLAADSGPSMDITLQWATYRDASDQCSLSRIYGGLHPPQDDVPGRKVGLTVGPQAYDKAYALMTAGAPRVDAITFNDETINDSNVGGQINVFILFDEMMNTGIEPTIAFTHDDPSVASLTAGTGTWLGDGMTFVQPYTVNDANETLNNIVFQISGAEDVDGHENIHAVSNAIVLDTENPMVTGALNDNAITTVNDAAVSTATPFNLTVMFSEMMDMNNTPTFNFTSDDASSTLVLNASNSSWSGDGMTYYASFDLADNNEELSNVDITSVSAMDAAGNDQISYSLSDVMIIDTKNPSVSASTATSVLINDAFVGDHFVMSFDFDEMMDTSMDPMISFPSGNPLNTMLFDAANSGWNGNTYTISYYTIDVNESVIVDNYMAVSAMDLFGNTLVSYSSSEGFIIDTQNPQVATLSVSNAIIADNEAGGPFQITVTFDEVMNTGVYPTITYNNGDPTMNTLLFDGFTTGWTDDHTFVAGYSVGDANEEIWNIGISSVEAEDANGNVQTMDYSMSDAFSVDTRNPTLLLLSSNTSNITGNYTGTDGFSIISIYDEPMDELTMPVITFPVETPTPLTPSANSEWVGNSYVTYYDVSTTLASLPNIDVEVSGSATDIAGNTGTVLTMADYFSINIMTAVDELSAENQVVVYPNPLEAGKTLFIEWYSVPTGLSIDVYNSVGALVVHKGQVSASEKRIALDTADLSSGMYIIHVNSDEGRSAFNVSIAR